MCCWNCNAGAALAKHVRPASSQRADLGSVSVKTADGTPVRVACGVAPRLLPREGKDDPAKVMSTSRQPDESPDLL